MTSRLLFLPLLSGAMLLTGCEFDIGDGDRFQKDFHESRAFHPGDRLTVETFNGSVDITTWDQNTIDISGTKNAATQQLLDDLKVDIQQSGNTLMVRSVRPSLNQGSMGVRFTLRVPRRLELDHITTSNGSVHIENVEGSARLKTSNGRIQADHVDGRLDAETTNGGISANHVSGNSVLRTSNGRIEGDAMGPVDATTTNGGIHVQVTGSTASAPMHFATSNGVIDISLAGPVRNDVHARTTNGGITLRLPGDVNAHVRASTSHSKINTDFPITMQGSESDHTLDGNIGSGGPQIELTNTNGSIHLIRAER
jgi:hypothetical protein